MSQSLLTLIILFLTVAAFITGRFRTDLIALCSMLALTLSGVLSAQESLAGFANPIIFTTAGMFVISGAIVRSGLASLISGKILKVAGKNTNVLFMTVMLLAALIGSLVSNTGTVAIMMPIVVGMAKTIDESPSRFLMPLAYMSSIGGMFTLIGNSPNMVVNDVYVKAGYPSLQLFSFLPIGIACLLFGMCVLAPVSSYILSRRKNEKSVFRKKSLSLRELADSYNLSRNMYTVVVPAKSPIVGKSLQELGLTERTGVVVQEITRRDPRRAPFRRQERPIQIAPESCTVVMAGDTLRLLGTAAAVQDMTEKCELGGASPVNKGKAASGIHFDSIGICELVLMSSSRLVSTTVAESGLRKQFGITVLSVHRGDQYLWENVKDLTLQSGDALLVQGTWANLGRLDEYSSHWVVVGRPLDQQGTSRRREKIPLVAGSIAAMLIAMTAGIVPTVAAVLLAALALVIGGCFRNMDDAYSTINWETLVMIACLLPMATAMDNTGILDVVAGRMVALGATYGPHAALAVVYAIASGMNILISTTPVALLVAPIAMQVAVGLGYNPLPFLYAVATATSMCFASPFSTPANALVMSAGRYTFLDYMKLGLPMQILMGVVMIFVIPWLFPFTI